MTGSPFSNVIGTDAGSSTFTDVRSTQTSDTTAANAARPPDSDTESSLGVEVQGIGTHEAAQDETAGGGQSGAPTP